MFIKLATAGFLAVMTTVGTVGTFLNLGAESPEHPQGISIREESSRSGAFFVGYYGSRGHSGGGLSGGK